jgi:hypothetical protein
VYRFQVGGAPVQFGIQHQGSAKTATNTNTGKRPPSHSRQLICRMAR